MTFEPASWPVARLGDVAVDVRYGYTASAVEQQVGPRFVRITDIVSGKVDWTRVPYCEVGDLAKARFALSVGDILIARTGPVGAPARMDRDEDAVFASYLVRIRADLSRVDGAP